MITAINVVGLLFACIFVIWAVYQGWDLPIAILAGAFLICITNGLDIIDTVSEMLDTISMMFGIFLMPTIMGCILTKVLVDSRGAYSCAVGILDIFGKDRDASFRRGIAIASTMLVICAMAFFSLSNTFLQGAVAISMAAATNIPRKYMITMCMLPVTISVLLPGNVGNAMYTAAYMPDVSRFSALPIAIIISAFVIILGFLILKKNIEKSIAEGNNFDYGPLADPNIEMSDEMPAWWLLFLPIAGILIPYAILSAEIWVSIAVGLIVALIVYEKYLPYGKGPEKLSRPQIVVKRYQMVIAGGCALVGMPLLMTMNMGLATAISLAPGFTVVSDFFLNLPFNPLVNLSLIGTVLTGISSGPSGFLLGLQMAAET